MLLAGLLLGVALPRWQEVRRQHREIGELQARLADLDRWTVAGLWLAPSLADREPRVAARWEELFPPRRAREELFLDLAAVADRCAVSAFALQEIDATGAAVGSDAAEEAWQTVPRDDDDEEEEEEEEEEARQAAGGRTAAEAREAAARQATARDRYRVQVRFAADYARTADFLDRLHDLPRAIDVHHLTVQPARTGLDVEMELLIHVSQANAS
jgi:hypothetical protein